MTRTSIERGGSAAGTELQTRALAEANVRSAEMLTRLGELNDQLKRERDKAETYLNLVSVIIVALDAQGRITLLNKFGQRVLGQSETGLVGRDWFETCLPARCREATRGVFRQLLAGEVKSAECYENEIVTGSGEERTIAWHNTVIRNEAGAVTGTLGAGEDITERVRAQHALEAARRGAEEANRAKSEFLANMSHEIRTPLNGIIGMTTLLMESDMTPEQRPDLELIKSSGDTLLALINDILDFSKIEARQLEVESVDLDLPAVIARTVENFALRAQQKGLELICDVPPGTPATVVGDPTRLAQVLTNLLGNAVKFTEQGEVVLSVEREPEGSGDGRARLRFSVRDTGIGITAEQRKRIFDPFTQADGSTTRKYGGTGLGLSISRQLVELMGGILQVDSEPGRGSDFHFTLAMAARPHAPSAARSAQADLRGLKVLVVDDNASNRLILTRMLTSWGMEAVAAADGLAGVEVLREAKLAGRPYRLLLLDYQMPGMCGLDVARVVAGDPALQGMPIVLLTSVDSGEVRRQCRAAGIQGCLVKPASQSRLFDMIIASVTGATGNGPAREHIASAPLARAARKLKVLLAEDNRVNQMVATKMLSRLGHDVTVVGNGQEALDALGREDFDAVLMDVQMPVMDGIMATRELRDRERRSGRHTPVIAMTAHALAGDRERLLDVGMDDYVSKPVNPAELVRALEQRGAPKDRANPNREPGIDATVLDLQELLQRVDGDRALVSELLQTFLDDADERLSRMRSAVTSGDAQLLLREAHALKGAAGSASAKQVFQHALEIERAGRAGELAGVRANLLVLERALAPLRAQIARLPEGSRSCVS